MTKKKPHIYTPLEIHQSLTAAESHELMHLMLRWDIEFSPRVHVRDSTIRDHRWWFAGCIAEVRGEHDVKWFTPANWCACADTPIRAARMAHELCTTLTGQWATVTAYNLDAWRHCDFKGTLKDAIDADLKKWGDEVVIPKYAHEMKLKKDRETCFVKRPNW